MLKVGLIMNTSAETVKFVLKSVNIIAIDCTNYMSETMLKMMSKYYFSSVNS